MQSFTKKFNIYKQKINKQFDSNRLRKTPSRKITAVLDSTSKVLEDSAKGGFYLTVGSIVSTIILGLSVIIITRILGSELYGLYTISTVIPSLLIIFLDPGINQGIIKFTSSFRTKEDSKGLRKLLLHGLSTETLLGLTASAACFIFSDHLANSFLINRPEISGFIKIASALIILQTITTTLNSAFIGFDKTEYNTLTTVIQAITKALISTVLLVLGLNIAGALIGYVASFAITSLIGIIFFIQKILKPLKHSDGDSASYSSNLRMLIKYGLPLYASALISGVALQYRVIIMSIFTSNAEIGNFQAAMNFNTILASISVPIATMLLPAFSKLEHKKDTIKEFFKISIKYTSMILLPISILLAVYAQEAVQIIYGAGFELTAYILSLYMTTYLLVGLGSNTLGSFFAGIGETKTNLKTTIINLITLMVLAPILTYSLKVTGIIIALILSSLAGTIYGLYTARKSYDIMINSKMLERIYLVALISALPIFIIKWMLAYSSILMMMLGAVTYLAIYLIMIPITGVITPAELKEIKKILEKIKLLNYLAKPIIYFEEKIFKAFPQTQLTQ